MHRSGLGSRVIHGKNLSPVGAVTAITPPDFLGSHQHGDPPEGTLTGNVSSPTHRMESVSCVLKEGATLGRDSRSHLTPHAAERQLEKSLASVQTNTLGHVMMHKGHSGLGDEVSLCPPSIKKGGQLVYGEALDGKLHGLGSEDTGPASEGTDSTVLPGPRQPLITLLFPPLAREVAPMLTNPQAGLLCDFDNMDSLRLKDDDGADFYGLDGKGGTDLDRE